MSNDDEPRPSQNPFIRFKNHVNTRIGAGISAITGSNTDRDVPPPGCPQSENPYSRSFGPEHTKPSSCANRKMFDPFDRARRRRDPIRGFQYWDKWAQLDPYSPYNLRHLPQPIPNDLPRDVDAGHFGFHEAFEDLMAVSGMENAPMMDLRGRADLKKSILKTFASGEPTLVWVRRLHGTGLLPPPFIWERPTLLDESRDRQEQTMEQEPHRPGPMREWLDQRRRTTETPEEIERKCAEDIEALKDLAAKKFKDLGGKGMSWDDMMDKLDTDITINPAEMVRKAEQAFRGFEKEIERYASELTSGNVQTRTPDDAEPASYDGQKKPSTEQDLFSMIRSAVAEADKSFNSFAKSITGIASSPGVWQAERERTEKSPGNEVVTYDSFGGKTVTTTSRHSDMFDNVHFKTEVRKLNKFGDEVGRETRYSVYYAKDAPDQKAREDYEEQSNPLRLQNEKSTRAREEEHRALADHTEGLPEKPRDERTDESGDDKNGKLTGWFWR